MTGSDYERGPYPQTWIHLYGKGRVFYPTLGHREDIWNHLVFQSILTGGLEWALHRVDAEIEPNLKSVAPRGQELPKYQPPAEGK